MKIVKIGVQGGKGSFSENAGLVFAKKQKINNFEIIYQISSERVLFELQKGETDFGIFAMENAQGGIVLESVEALSRYNCRIIDMFHMPIRQNLLCLNEIVLNDISEIYSHRQALRQCRNYLAEKFWSIPLIEQDDTAESAKRLSAGLLPKTAAVIGNKECSSLYGLKVIESDIHDLKNNLTLFLGVSSEC